MRVVQAEWAALQTALIQPRDCNSSWESGLCFCVTSGKACPVSGPQSPPELHVLGGLAGEVRNSWGIATARQSMRQTYSSSALPSGDPDSPFSGPLEYICRKSCKCGWSLPGASRLTLGIPSDAFGDAPLFHPRLHEFLSLFTHLFLQRDVGGPQKEVGHPHYLASQGTVPVSWPPAGSVPPSAVGTMGW